jgi:phage baseplate assembly protein W
MAQKFVGITLPVRLGATGMFEQSTTVIEQTRTNFKNLILTKKGERVGQPELGCDLWSVLFEQMNEDTQDAAKLAVESAVNRWLPFIELVNFSITPVERTNTYNINCLYRFRNNPNVTDLVSISTTELGTPTVGFQTEPQPNTEEFNTFQDSVEESRRLRRIQEARRLRRI